MKQDSQHLFIVRIWFETGTEPDPIWRGSVEHIPSGERQYFVQLSSLVEFIRFRLEVNSNVGFLGGVSEAEDQPEP